MSAQHISGAEHPPRLLRLPEVMARVGMSRSAIYLAIANGAFPASIRVGSHTVAWVEEEINAWVRARIAASRGAR